ncbi:FmdB family zinc ribbon protein [Acinetobacter haemolyticus]|uniref:zinc ribbon domain-containing protein n=1 Tax=Acinetobacter haemolyticus TaxID=29430 RepID=UPI000E568DF2|nr:zinc ribbon domain-containing protein [Acinetobacter haemolyticus]QDJ91878.1 zinc ribbon domain-containing protein [Acinetobacter haemolyticus]
MALKPCKECGNQVSDKADKCPNCGVKIKKPMSLLVFLGILFLIFAFIGSCFDKSDSASNKVTGTSTSPIELKEKIIRPDIGVVVEAKSYIKRTLKDPNSVEFRGVDAFFTNEGGVVACGEVNAKNSLGGYVGFRHFISNGRWVLYDEDPTTDFVRAFRELCYSKSRKNTD